MHTPKMPNKIFDFFFSWLTISGPENAVNCTAFQRVRLQTFPGRACPCTPLEVPESGTCACPPADPFNPILPKPCPTKIFKRENHFTPCHAISVTSCHKIHKIPMKHLPAAETELIYRFSQG